MPKFFVKLLFIVMAAVMVVTACGTAADNPASYTNPPAYEDPTLVPAMDTAATELPATDLPATEAATAGPVSFSADILPIFESRCVSCHGGNKTEKGLDLKSFASLMNGSEEGPVVTAGDAANSSLASLILNGKMPKRGPKLPPEQVQLIIDWINQGALDN